MNAAVVTTLNEAESIGWLVAGLREQGLRVCVVDDASDDDTAYLAVHAGAHVIQHCLRRGIGPRLQEGWRWALGEKATAVVQLDAGRSHFPGTANVLLGRLGDADVVVGSRFRDGAFYHGSLRRQLMSRAAALACNVRYGDGLLGLPVHGRTGSPGNHALTGISDWTSGYRAFSAAALRKLARLEYTATMHGWQIEVLLACQWLGLRVVEAPITYMGGRSSFSRRVAKEAFGVWNSQRFALQS